MSGFIAGSVISGGASYLGAKEQAKSTDRATEEGRRQFERQVQLQAPFREGGIQALNKLIPMAMNYKPFSLKDFEVDPGYEFRRREGLRAIENSALAGGMGRSGSTLRGLTRYGQELGSEEFMNAFNRYQTNRSAEMNPLLSLAGAAQTSSNTLSDAAGRLGEQIGSNLIQGGVARASGYAGIANAANAGLSNYLAYQQNQARNRLDQQYIDTLRSRANTYSDVV
jgi:hypothetical protein